MSTHRLGCIADDYTGATDLCSMLVRTGRRVIQCFGVPEADRCTELRDADVVVVALKSRSTAPEEAVEQSVGALRFLQGWGASRFFFKYCSTFDSTSQGNIGPVADALAAELGVKRLFFCPAFPENGRTVQRGHLFVNGVALSESGMRNHPLNPMTDSNLVRVLQAQTSQPVDWISPSADAISSKAVRLIVDTINDEDLAAAAELASDHPLLTGGSAIAGCWADAAGVQRSGAWHDQSTAGNDSFSAVVLAGSCSDATRIQVAEFEKTKPVYHLNISDSVTAESVAVEALDWCASQWGQNRINSESMLISSGACPNAIAAARQRWGDREAAERTESIFAAIAIGLQGLGITKLIVAGGETSGIVVNALKIPAVRIGHEITPGVPWVTSIGEPAMSLALKSGNFGSPRFFFDALETSP